MPFSEELTVNDIIRKIKERIEYLKSEIEIERMNELQELLNYIEKDGEY